MPDIWELHTHCAQSSGMLRGLTWSHRLVKGGHHAHHELELIPGLWHSQPAQQPHNTLEEERHHAHHELELSLDRPDQEFCARRNTLGVSGRPFAARPAAPVPGPLIALRPLVVLIICT